MEFSGGEIGGWCALVPNIVNAISTHGEMSSVWFALLWLVVTDNMSNRICASLRDIKILDKEASVCAFVLTNALEQSTKFISKLCVHMSQYLGILMSW
jgi:hypothetical protein